MNDSNAKFAESLKHLNRRLGARSQKERKEFSPYLFIRIFISCVICICVRALSVSAPVSVILLLCAGILSGYNIIIDGVDNVMQERYFDRTSIMTLIFIVSFCIGFGYEGAWLMILVQVGGLLNSYVTDQTKNQVINMTNLDFETATVLESDGTAAEKFLNEVHAGDEIIVRTGEYFPLDCMVATGTSEIDSSKIDGRSAGVTVSVGDTVPAGSLNLGQTLQCEVLTEKGEDTASKLLRTLSQQPEPARIPRKFERWFTPIVLAVSIAFAIMIAVTKKADAYDAIHRALVLFTLSSAFPVFSGFGNIRYAARAGALTRGVAFRSDDVLTETAACTDVVFSAEGILTTGKQKVVQVDSSKLDSQTFLKIAAHAVAFSKNPDAVSIIQAYHGPIYVEHIQDFTEIPNCGVKVLFDGVPVILGTQMLLAAAGNSVAKPEQDQEVLFLMVGHEMVGTLTLSDPIRKSSETILPLLQEQGITRETFCTAYSEATAEKIAEKSGIRTYQANCGEDARLHFVETCKGENHQPLLYFRHGKTLPKCHSSAALDAVMDSAQNIDATEWDIFLPGIHPTTLAEAFRVARSAKKLNQISAGFICVVKAILLAVAAAGLTTVWFSALLELVAVLLIKVFSTQAFFEKPFQNLRKKEH